MEDPRPFLSLVLRQRGTAYLNSRVKPSPETVANLKNRVGHAAALRTKRTAIQRDWERETHQRRSEGRPDMPGGFPLLLRVDPKLDIEFLRTSFGLEILCEQENGYLLAAANDFDLDAFERVVGKFEIKKRGGGTAAQLHDVLGPQQRLAHVLSPDLLALWPSIEADRRYIVDLSFHCLGTISPPKKLVPRKESESEVRFAGRKANYDLKFDAAYYAWDNLRAERAANVLQLGKHYSAVELQSVDGDREAHMLPDSFTIRLRISGDGLRDLVLNLPYLFEACLPEEVQQPAGPDGSPLGGHSLTLVPPPQDAPRVCVIDSGIQENHVLIAKPSGGTSTTA